MAIGNGDFKQEWLSIRIIHVALLAGPAMFMFVSVFLNSGHYVYHFPPEQMELVFLNILFMAIAPGLGRYSIRRMKKKLSHHEGSKLEALAIYRIGKMVQWALLEGAGLFAIVTFFITANVFYLPFAAFQLVLLVLARPVRRDLSE